MYDWVRQQVDQQALNAEIEFEAQQSRLPDPRYSATDTDPQVTETPRWWWLRFGAAAGALTLAVVLLVVVS